MARGIGIQEHLAEELEHEPLARIRRGVRREEDDLQAILEQREELCLLLEGLVESLSDGVAALDIRGQAVHVSASLGESGALPREVLERLRQEAQGIQPGQARRFDLAWDRPESGVRTYSVVGSAGALQRGSRLLTVFAFHDRTREMALEEELAQARQMAALGQMAATVAHELRNPLGAIEGFATLLRRDLAGQTGPLRQVERILRGVENADRIVADLLEYCRPLQFHPEAVPLAEVVEESLADLKTSPRWTERVSVDADTDQGLPLCRADRRLLRMVLSNLYDNAIDAMGGQGELSLRLRAVGPAGTADRVRLIVRDTGCGLTAEEVARIFAPFYTTKPGGTGLGLALVRKIVEAHGGHVHMVSAPGRGTSVVLDLPAAECSLTTEPEDGRAEEAA